MHFLKTLGVHLILILLLVVGLFVVVSGFLSSYTRHGEYLSVPDLNGLQIDDAIHLLNEKKLRYVISDSLYFEEKPKLSILEQNPAAKSNVKEGRVIYLTINSNSVPSVILPNLLDVSLRQAEAMLTAVGLKTGKLIYKPDIAKDVVLEMQLYHSTLTPGKKISKGSAIDLVLGNGLEGESIALPNLLGLTLEEANNLLSSSSLTLGSVVYLGAISDSASATIYKQNPSYSEGSTINGGQPVDLFLKQ
jgi:beta-lactam-binding protein with PASTA domain